MNKKLSTSDMVFCSIFAALAVVFSYIRIPLPFSPVPVTLQTLAVMLAGSLLPPDTAFLSMLVYVIMRLVGLPFSAPGPAGFGLLLGPTGGYIISWPLGAYTIASLLKSGDPSLSKLFLSNALGGILLVDTLGTLYLSFITGMKLPAAVIAGMLPFIPGDILKAVFASVLAFSLRKNKAILFDNRKGRLYN
ncbi:MAG: biotin transporter BioY [Bacillota bacterium]